MYGGIPTRGPPRMPPPPGLAKVPPPGRRGPPQIPPPMNSSRGPPSVPPPSSRGPPSKPSSRGPPSIPPPSSRGPPSIPSSGGPPTIPLPSSRGPPSIPSSRGPPSVPLPSSRGPPSIPSSRGPPSIPSSRGPPSVPPPPTVTPKPSSRVPSSSSSKSNSFNSAISSLAAKFQPRSSPIPSRPSPTSSRAPPPPKSPSFSTTSSSFIPPPPIPSSTHVPPPPPSSSSSLSPSSLSPPPPIPRSAPSQPIPPASSSSSSSSSSLSSSSSPPPPSSSEGSKKGPPPALPTRPPKRAERTIRRAGPVIVPEGPEKKKNPNVSISVPTTHREDDIQAMQNQSILSKLKPKKFTVYHVSIRPLANNGRDSEVQKRWKDFVNFDEQWKRLYPGVHINFGLQEEARDITDILHTKNSQVIVNRRKTLLTNYLMCLAGVKAMHPLLAEFLKVEEKVLDPHSRRTSKIVALPTAEVFLQNKCKMKGNDDAASARAYADKEAFLKANAGLLEALLPGHRVHLTAGSDSVEGANSMSFGEIKLAASFRYDKIVLDVIEAKNIPPIRGASNPYIKVSLHPDPAKKSKQKSRPQNRTLNPIFNEQFEVPINSMELNSKDLHIALWNNDLAHSNVGICGVTIPCNKIPTGSMTPKWFTMQAFDNFTPTTVSLGGSGGSYNSSSYNSSSNRAPPTPLYNRGGYASSSSRSPPPPPSSSSGTAGIAASLASRFSGGSANNRERKAPPIPRSAPSPIRRASPPGRPQVGGYSSSASRGPPPAPSSGTGIGTKKTPKFCPECGEPVSKVGSKFCPECGNRF